MRTCPRRSPCPTTSWPPAPTPRWCAARPPRAAPRLRLSLELLRTEGRGDRVVVVTNDYHAFRAAIITREQGLLAQVVGAPTARYFLPSAVLREFVGVLVRQPWPHAVVVALVAGLAALLVAVSR
uniref:YdcF family protein n=1 Tax=Ornithinimicrobium avium TaxID=2283195 RepID=UPI0038995E04